jgi:hypothetical protein
MAEEPHNADEFLDRESRMAREALRQLRGEALESLSRSVDVNAWAERYPWQSLGVAATAGLGAGWALGRTFRRKPSEADNRPTDYETDDMNASESARPHAANRLMSGLGTLTGALASAAFTAAAESLTEVVKQTMRDAINPVEPNSNQAGSDDDSLPNDPADGYPDGT